jgi:hypothetical protein
MTATGTYPAPAAEPTSRPLGVAILAVLVGIFGILLIIGGILILALGVTSSVIGAGFFGETGIVLGAIVLIVGLIILGVALGLYHLRLWALVLALIVTFFELVAYGYAGHFVSLGFILALIIFVYLLAVHRHFH